MIANAYVVSAFRRTPFGRTPVRRTPFRRTSRLAIALWLLAIGCRAPAKPPLRAVSLPDLSSAAESVQSQLRQRYEALTRVTANPQASPAEQAEAYGAMGMLLMAAEYREAAEAFLLNAESLSPEVVKWPYYLAHLYSCLLYTSPSPRDRQKSRMPSSA